MLCITRSHNICTLAGGRVHSEVLGVYQEGNTRESRGQGRVCVCVRYLPYFHPLAVNGEQRSLDLAALSSRPPTHMASPSAVLDPQVRPHQGYTGFPRHPPVVPFPMKIRVDRRETASTKSLKVTSHHQQQAHQYYCTGLTVLGFPRIG
eukprot:sb/3473614/